MNRNSQLALLIAVVLGLWIGSGFLIEPSEDIQAVESEEQNLITVRARHLQAQPFTRQLRVSSRTEAKREVAVRAEIDGKVIEVPIEKGRPVKTGETLCKLAPEDRELRVKQSKALVDRAQLEYDGALRLKSGGFQSRTTIAAKKAELETAKANLERSILDLANLTIKAPFDGVFVDRLVEEGDFIRRGDSCGIVLDLDPLVIAGEVSAVEVEHLSLGSEVIIELLSGEQLMGKLTYVSQLADVITRAYRIEVETGNSEQRYRSGITAQLILSLDETMAHHLSPALLALDDQGKVGVRILDKDSRVHFVGVELVGNDAEGIWVTGLPDKTLLITVGQEYVSDGQQVSVTLEPHDQTNAARL